MLPSRLTTFRRLSLLPRLLRNTPIESLLLLAEINRLWFAPPLIVATSFVYAGTRHEKLPAILRHTGSCAATMLLIMGGVACVLEVLAYLQ